MVPRTLLTVNKARTADADRPRQCQAEETDEVFFMGGTELERRTAEKIRNYFDPAKAPWLVDHLIL